MEIEEIYKRGVKMGVSMKKGSSKSAVRKNADKLDELMRKMASEKTYKDYLKIRTEFRSELGLEN